jgi:hypothetical protein
MVKIAKKIAGKKRSVKSNPEPPAAPGPPWSAEALIAAIEAGSVEEKVARLKTVGILTPTGKLAKRYRSWGTNVSRTPELEEDPAVTSNEVP